MNTILTQSEKRLIGRYLLDHYESRGARAVRFADDGAVTVMLDEMPNTSIPGRIFAGWDCDLLKLAKRSPA